MHLRNCHILRLNCSPFDWLGCVCRSTILILIDLLLLISVYIVYLFPSWFICCLFICLFIYLFIYFLFGGAWRCKKKDYPSFFRDYPYFQNFWVVTLPETSIAGWKIHHFDGIYQERWGFSMGEMAMLVSGVVTSISSKWNHDNDLC